MEFLHKIMISDRYKVSSYSRWNFKVMRPWAYQEIRSVDEDCDITRESGTEHYKNSRVEKILQYLQCAICLYALSARWIMEARTQR